MLIARIGWALQSKLRKPDFPLPYRCFRYSRSDAPSPYLATRRSRAAFSTSLRRGAELPKPTSPNLSLPDVAQAYKFMGMDPNREYSLADFRECKNRVSSFCDSTSNSDLILAMVSQAAIKHMTGKEGYDFTRHKEVLQELLWADFSGMKGCKLTEFIVSEGHMKEHSCEMVPPLSRLYGEVKTNLRPPLASSQPSGPPHRKHAPKASNAPASRQTKQSTPVSKATSAPRLSAERRAERKAHARGVLMVTRTAGQARAVADKIGQDWLKSHDPQRVTDGLAAILQATTPYQAEVLFFGLLDANVAERNSALAVTKANPALSRSLKHDIEERLLACDREMGLNRDNLIGKFKQLGAIR